MPGVSSPTVLFVRIVLDSDTFPIMSVLYLLFVLIPYYFDAVEEGKVACFLLATTAILQLRYALMKKMMLLEVGF